ncbi:MAG: tetratricopeptide repeat protein [Bacteroidales bacterium]|jgi:tetratricopeptide (TPR) repeat protein|nr:tetratricopeptide repeat protein [Bacteroidales bacterium]
MRIVQLIKENPSKYLFVGLAFILLCVSFRMSFNAGMSGDEQFQMDQAKNVYKFYTTLGQDTTAAHFREEWNLAHYAQFIDNLAYAIAKIFNIEDQLLVRHITNSICGWFMILLGGLIAFQIAGKWRAAMIVALLMFFSPRLLGHSFNNLKDTSFATAMLFGIYTFIRFFKEFPKPSWKTLVLMALSIGFAFGVRIGGILLIPYLGLFGLVYFIKEYSFKSFVKEKERSLFWKMVKWGLLVSIVGYILGILVWPYGLTGPISHTIHTFKGQSGFSTAIRQVFEGSSQWSDLLPWYYTPKFILMTIPTAILIGLGLFFALLWKDKKNYFWYFIVFFAFFFPIFWIVYTNANVYGGWRHALFAYPAMVVAAGLGFELLLKWLGTKFSKFIPIFGIAFVAVLLWHPIRHVLKNHPYEYVYFNELFGGVEKAYGNYELDYYYHSTREASEWIIKNAEKTGLETSDKIKVASWHTASVGYFFRNDTAKFEINFSRWYERGNNDWDYAIFTVTGMSPDMLKHPEAFPPANTVHEIKVDGKPICVILKRTDKSDYYGNILKGQGQQDSAVVLFQKSLTVVPTDESVLLNLGEIYLNKQQYDSAISYLDKLLAFDPKNESANYYKAYALMFQNRLNEAQSCLQVIVNHNPKNEAAPWMAAQVYARQGNLILMDKMIERTLIANAGKQQEALTFMQQVYPQLGLSANDAMMSFTKIWIRVLEELGYKEEAEQLKKNK